MCGRYTLIQAGLLPEFFEISDVRLPPRFNIAPTQEAPIVRAESGERRLDLFRWGLVPYWSKDPSVGARMINARVESVEEKPSFRTPFQKQRCLVPADGFYEWSARPGGKQPFYFRLRSGNLFAFAGIWDRNRNSESPIQTYSIITCPANETVGQVHPRMPVILPESLYETWLDSGITSLELKPLLAPYPDSEMEAFPVSKMVNSPRNDQPECIDRIPDP